MSIYAWLQKGARKANTDVIKNATEANSESSANTSVSGSDSVNENKDSKLGTTKCRKYQDNDGVPATVTGDGCTEKVQVITDNESDAFVQEDILSLADDHSSMDLSLSVDEDVVVNEDRESEFPKCWTNDMFVAKCREYDWLVVKNGFIGCKMCARVKRVLLTNEATQTGVQIAKEWINISVGPNGETKAAKQQSLRKKIFKHRNSKAHIAAVNTLKTSRKEVLQTCVEEQEKEHSKSTSAVFRTVYKNVKLNRPFTDLPHDVKLQQLNGMNLGRTNHSDHAAAKMTQHIANEMQKKVMQEVIQNDSKIGVLIDEATSVSHKAALVIVLKTSVKENSDPVMMFLELVELESTTSKAITDAVLASLNKYGFIHEYLIKRFVSFACDGASAMLGRKSGVAAALVNKYPDLIVWHCANHRLELAVGDVVKEIQGVNHLKVFFDKLYTVYNVSTKNSKELRECGSELEIQILKIGRILGTRWVASSERTIKSVWNNYTALHAHFKKASVDQNRDTKERAQYLGLKLRISSFAFVNDLGIMFDALSELADLSLQLQKRDMTVPKAHTLIDRTIRVFSSMIDNPGTRLMEAKKAISTKVFKGVQLHEGTKHSSKINSGQFFRSLSENMQSRMFTTQSSHVGVASDHATLHCEYMDLIAKLDLLDPSKWPETLDIQHGDDSVRKLCARFKIDERTGIRGFREFEDNQGTMVPNDMKPLTTAVKTLIVSTSECERAFSAMNLIITSSRNRLEIPITSSLLFIKTVGPPLELFNPEPYVRSWFLSGHRSVEHTSCRGTEEKKVNSVLEDVWKIC